MPKRVAAPDYCLIARTMEALGEQWTLLIVRDAFFGIRHFDEFQKSLGIARNVLADRLAKLVDEGVLTRAQHPDDRRKVEYRLTDKGRDLLPVIISLTQWGVKWKRGEGEGVPFRFVDRETGSGIARIEVRSTEGKPLTARDLAIKPGPALTDAIRAHIPALRDSV
ncbi:MAG: helix-turn-helix transcriptional regulator [Alphaproteobacteria bacterium]|nr:helix-turn-helix transcriptional regulator [Alphaproteobacteria bacterium]